MVALAFCVLKSSLRKYGKIITPWDFGNDIFYNSIPLLIGDE